MKLSNKTSNIGRKRISRFGYNLLLAALLCLSQKDAVGQGKYREPVDISELKGNRTDPKAQIFDRSQEIYQELFQEFTKHEKVFIDQNRRKIGYAHFPNVESICVKSDRTDIIDEIEGIDINQDEGIYLLADVKIFPGATDQQDIMFVATPHNKKHTLFRIYAINTELRQSEITTVEIVSNTPLGFKQPVYDYIRRTAIECDNTIHALISGSGKHIQEEPYILNAEGTIKQHTQVYLPLDGEWQHIPDELFKTNDIKKNEQEIRVLLSERYGCDVDEICFSNEELTYDDIVTHNLKREIYLPGGNEKMSLKDFIEKDLEGRNLPSVFKDAMRKGWGAVESNYDPDAVSSARAVTVLQVVDGLLGAELERRYDFKLDTSPEKEGEMIQAVFDFTEDYYHIFRYGEPAPYSSLDLGSFSCNFKEDIIHEQLDFIAETFGFDSDDEKDAIVHWYFKLGYIGGYPKRAPDMIQWFVDYLADPTCLDEETCANGEQHRIDYMQRLGWIDENGITTNKERDVDEFMLTLIQDYKALGRDDRFQEKYADERLADDGGFGKETFTYGARIRSFANKVKNKIKEWLK